MITLEQHASRMTALASNQSTGLWREDHKSFSLFIDEDGGDEYQVPHGLAFTTDNSITGFFDLGGCDAYVVRSAEKEGDGNTIVRSKGGLFIDQTGC